MSLLDDYHREFYSRELWQVNWLGVKVCKYPSDLFVFQEIIHRRMPGLLIEMGTYTGGSAWFFATIMDLVGDGRVLTIDKSDRPLRPNHHRITYLLGDSADPRIVDEVRKVAEDYKRVMVVLDSDHSQVHVGRELDAYADVVTPGDYLVVEDTNLNGHPVFPDHGPGPWEALQEFLSKDDRFTPDTECERFGLTSNPGGWLRRNNWK
jgi:cephalosporin hydroxylase